MMMREMYDVSKMRSNCYEPYLNVESTSMLLHLMIHCLKNLAKKHAQPLRIIK